MLPVCGKPTRNFQAGQVLAKKMKEEERCPHQMEELEEWCESDGLQKGGLEGLKSLRYWPQIVRNYSIPLHDSSMVNLLYMSIYGNQSSKGVAYSVMTESRELTNYCQESVRPTHSRRYAEALQNLDNTEAIDLIVNAVIADNGRRAIRDDSFLNDSEAVDKTPAYLRAMNAIETSL